MMSKIVPFSDSHFEISRQTPLSAMMIETLKAACAKQNQGIAFGQGDIKGSFISLVKRGLIINKETAISRSSECHWHVTSQAVQMLEKLGIRVSC